MRKFFLTIILTLWIINLVSSRPISDGIADTDFDETKPPTIPFSKLITLARDSVNQLNSIILELMGTTSSESLLHTIQISGKEYASKLEEMLSQLSDGTRTRTIIADELIAPLATHIGDAIEEFKENNPNIGNSIQKFGNILQDNFLTVLNNASEFADKYPVEGNAIVERSQIIAQDIFEFIKDTAKYLISD